MRAPRKIATWAAAVACASLGFVFASAQPASADRSKTVVIVHGFDPPPFDPETNCKGDPFTDFFDSRDFLKFLEDRGYDKVSTVKYYSKDKNCDKSISDDIGRSDDPNRPANDRRGAKHPRRGKHRSSGHPSGSSGDPSGIGHTRSTRLEHLAYHLAWHIHKEYTKNDESVDVLAHSMGGAIVRYALAKVDKKHRDFPLRLLVDDVVTVGTPHNGANPTVTTLCDPITGGIVNVTQCLQLSRRDASPHFLDRMADGDQGRHPNPSNSDATTDWTVIGSVSDNVINPGNGPVEHSAIRMPFADHRFNYTARGFFEGRTEGKYPHGEFFKDLGAEDLNKLKFEADETPDGVLNASSVPQSQRKRGGRLIDAALNSGGS